MKLLLSMLLIILSILCSANVYPETTALAQPLPVGRIQAVGSKLYVGTRQVYLRGANISYMACFPPDPAALARDLKRRGYNAVRLHHVDGLIRTGAKTPADLLATVDAFWAEGLYTCMDGLSDYWADRKRLFYEGDAATRQGLKDYWASIAPVLRHPGLWLFCLINEGATELLNTHGAGATALCIESYGWGKAVLRELGFQGLVTDIPDGFINSDVFGPAGSRMDVAAVHFYGHHPEGSRFIPLNWAQNGYMEGRLDYYAQTTGRPLVVQEWGCLPFAANRSVNEAFFASHAIRNYAGAFSFQWASNHAQLEGQFDQVDTFSMVTDYQRVVSDVLGALLTKYEAPETGYYWGHVAQAQALDPNYFRTTLKTKLFVDESKGTAIVSPTTTKRFVVLLDDVAIRGYEAKPLPEGWQEVLNRGSKVLGHWEGKWVDLGRTVSGAYRLNPWTLAKQATLPKSGSLFYADRSCSVYEVNLS